MEPTEERCSICGGSAGTLIDGAHALCTARARHSIEVPCLGDRCSVCHGSKHASKLAPGQAGPCLSLDHMTPGQMKRSIDALFPLCPHCGGTGVEPGTADPQPMRIVRN